MAIQFRSTPKRAQRDTSADAILSRQDFEDAVAAVNMTLAEIAKQTGVNRQYLSEFKCGDRNLRAETLQKLRDFFESKGVEFVDAMELEVDDDYVDDDAPIATLTVTDRKAVLRELDSVVQKNNFQLATAIEYHFAFPDDLTGKSARVQNELDQGLAAEAILRRKLAGTFKARNAKAKATTHADLVAQKYLHCLPVAGSATDPEPLANSSDENSVADAASAGAARGKGPSAEDPSFTEFVSGKGPSTEDSSFAEFLGGEG